MHILLHIYIYMNSIKQQSGRLKIYNKQRDNQHINWTGGWSWCFYIIGKNRRTKNIHRDNLHEGENQNGFWKHTKKIGR